MLIESMESLAGAGHTQEKENRAIHTDDVFIAEAADAKADLGLGYRGDVYPPLNGREHADHFPRPELRAV